ncbi:hypothetical protein L249_3146 [Ophiocordyceps polyrhachis-furcata BCC 54312]|uniref:Carrier domain-containing protein n=1 Tax=Ophiocordyceps polyrhachis-furcata BCC 54312 TaxID=1330021 RepID=A0A367LPR9_9HYPO|nr:hypothetical protein L249_3146 [Ophiocordyceps polyrhachis-furcata BCC 54312]
MTTEGQINICIFKPLRGDDLPDDRPGRLSAHLETANIKCEESHVPSTSFILTAWALFLKTYLATTAVSFSTLGFRFDSPADEASENALVHSLEFKDHDTISDVLDRTLASTSWKPLDTTASPCFNTLLLYRSAETSTSETASQMDICLVVTDRRELGLSLDMNICGTKFSSSITYRLLHTYRHILVMLSTASLSQTIATLCPLTRDDLQQVRRWNQRPPRRHDACVHQVFERQARRRPSSPAVCSWDGELTYAELDKLSTKLAHELSRLAVGPEVFVPYSFEKSLYAVVATLAVLKAGGAFVPLDSSHPQDRLRSIVSRLGAKILLASPGTSSVFQGMSLHVLTVDQPLLDRLPDQTHDPETEVGPRNSAFVLFTSGSTGEPKGLVQEHSSVCTVNAAYGDSLFINENSRVLSFAAHTFDVSTVDVFATLSQGGCVCIPSEDGRLNDLVPVINEFRVNWVDLTPSFAVASIPCPEEVPTLETLVLAGEGVKREHLAHFVGKISRVINCYGPAEAGGCLAQVYKSVTCQPQTVGRPPKSARCWIVDVNNWRRLAPVGAAGELVIEGPTLARGYLNDARKTKSVFFSRSSWTRRRSYGRFYRTGDLVRYRPDGLINFVGRRDTQAKIRGQRVELTEVEDHLADDASVSLCLVEFPRSGVYADRLVGVIQPRLCCDDAVTLNLVPTETLVHSGFSVHDLAARLSRRVPTYMMPSQWLVVNSLPLTDSKKVDRRRVRNWLADMPVSVSGDPCPLIPLENKLALELSRKVSALAARGNERVKAALDGRTFDLAATGVDSIQVMTLSRWIHEVYGLKLSVNTLTASGLTIEKLAELIAALQNGHKQLEAFDMRGEVSSLSKLCSTPKSGRLQHLASTKAVLLTGGTGFLGIEILRQLLCNYDVDIMVHVRASSLHHGRDRVVSAANKAGWWSEAFHRRLEIWIGDLGHVKLGLREEQWNRLIGGDSMIDVIIHNGAAVRWNQAYESLRAQNTLSTVQLLEAMTSRRRTGRFVYVSGGQALTSEVDDEDQMMVNSVDLTGYAQTKMVSELLVKRFASSEPGRRHTVRIVKPSYIIGDAQTGRANQSDYLWGLTRSAIELGTYSRESLDGWLYVSSVDRVAEAVCQICKPGISTSSLVKMLDGLPMREFWDMLKRDFGYELEAVDGGEWWSSLLSHVERTGPGHCLWPLQHMLEAERGEVASKVTVLTPEMTEGTTRTLEAMRKNIQHLKEDARFFWNRGDGASV